MKAWPPSWIYCVKKDIGMQNIFFLLFSKIHLDL